MQTNSQLIHHNQTVIPESVMKALELREGMTITNKFGGNILRLAISTR
jgi:hypothetical protein